MTSIISEHVWKDFLPLLQLQLQHPRKTSTSSYEVQIFIWVHWNTLIRAIITCRMLWNREILPLKRYDIVKMTKIDTLIQIQQQLQVSTNMSTHM